MKRAIISAESGSSIEDTDTSTGLASQLARTVRLIRSHLQLNQTRALPAKAVLSRKTRKDRSGENRCFMESPNGFSAQPVTRSTTWNKVDLGVA